MTTPEQRSVYEGKSTEQIRAEEDHVTLADLPPLPARQPCEIENPTLLHGRSLPCLIDGPHEIHRDSTGREWGDLDDLHARAAADQESLIGTVNGVPGVRYGHTRPQAPINRKRLGLS